LLQLLWGQLLCMAFRPIHPTARVAVVLLLPSCFQLGAASLCCLEGLCSSCHGTAAVGVLQHLLRLHCCCLAGTLHVRHGLLLLLMLPSLVGF
jgi:hypothetical protein